MISALGDIALSIDAEFIRYLQPVMEVLNGASQASKAVDPTDEDLVEYMNTLRESILEAYTGIFQALAQSGQIAQLMGPHIGQITEFLQCLAADIQTRTEAVTIACVGLIGYVFLFKRNNNVNRTNVVCYYRDMGLSLGALMKEMMQRDFVRQLLSECATIQQPNAQKIGSWAKGIVAKIC